MITRRTLLRTGVAASATLGTAGLLLPALTDVAQAADLDASTIPKFAQAMPVPQPLEPYSDDGDADVYKLTMKETTAEIVPGFRTAVRTYGDSFPGPLIQATSGRPVVIHQTNRLSVDTSVHLHGGHVPAKSDGAPMDLIAAGGGRRTYVYPNQQPHANLWFHDHAHHMESENVFRGLAGLYLLTDDVEDGLDLPDEEQDVPIALRDARFDSAGQLVYVMGDRLRNVVLANGKAWPYFEVATRRYRFRVFNTSNQRFFKLALSDGSAFQQIGSDGGLLPAPLTTTSVFLSPGERADVVVDFGHYPVGTTLVLKNTFGDQSAPTAQVLQFRVTRRERDDTEPLPDTLRTLPELPAATTTRDFKLSMDEGPATPGAMPMAYINGLVYDSDRIDTVIPYGSTEIWTVTNTNQRMPHNFHLHLVQFRVLERGGKPVTSGPECGLKDTVSLLPGESVKLQATFTGYRGEYLYHCHLIDHAAMGMMGTMKIV
ncbi:multicopper oxidase family protein [Kitasatospora sp. NPDC101176]|uniref:multicopper oxidase family protein n=1 Tax=Kitasatospora sp. NPDC101176 TaxID=3364099 RepID=UPI00380E38A2